MLPSHLFVSSIDGHMYDTRVADWGKKAPLRRNYYGGYSGIKTVGDLKAMLRAGAFTGMGGYPLFFVTSDGAALSYEAVEENIRSVMDSIMNDHRDGWRVVSVEINYEDAELRCDHTGKGIPSAYGEE